jgi:hypothetical protein
MRQVIILASILANSVISEYTHERTDTGNVLKPFYYFFSPQIGRIEVPHWQDFERFHPNSIKGQKTPPSNSFNGIPVSLSKEADDTVSVTRVISI